MRCYLLVDFGSTYTKLNLVDIDKSEIMGSASAYTTVESNVKTGFLNALEKLKGKVNFKEIEIVETLACSSAGGGLKMIAIGITPEFTVEAAKRSALGAGSRLLKTYSYFLTDDDVMEIDELRPDILLLTGGAEKGNTRYIIHNAKKLTQLKSPIPIVVAGNSSGQDEIREMFEKNNMKFVITENVMPDVNVINPNPAREVIRKIFMEQIVKTKGMEEVQKITNEILMPTPTAVLKSAELLAKGTKRYPGLGDLMIIDIGGATTDVHSISEPLQDKGFLLDGLGDVVEKRTVEGDLGMRYSALSLLESVGEDNFLKFDSSLEDVEGSCLYRKNNPGYLPENEVEKKFDLIMAKNCTEVATKRHSGKVRQSYVNGKNVIVQRGKDLRNIEYVIGTGGVIVNNSSYEEILSQCQIDEENLLCPISPEYKVDKKYIMSAMGVLSIKDPDMAYKILYENIIEED